MTSARECELQDGRLFLSEVSLRVAGGLRGTAPDPKVRRCLPPSPGVVVGGIGGGDTLSRSREGLFGVACCAPVGHSRSERERSWVVDTHQIGSETFVKYMQPGRGVQPGHPCFLSLPLGLQCLSRKPQNLDLFQEAAVSATGIRASGQRRGAKPPDWPPRRAWYLSTW